MSALDQLVELVPPPRSPSGADFDWDAVATELGGEVPADYRELIGRYGCGVLADVALLVPGHPNRNLDLLEQTERQRGALRTLASEEAIDSPYDPDTLVPWGIDGAGNVLWWLAGGGHPVVASEARGDEWQRHDAGAVSFLLALVKGEETSVFLSVGGNEFEPLPPG